MGVPLASETRILLPMESYRMRHVPPAGSTSAVMRFKGSKILTIERTSWNLPAAS